MTYLTPSSHPPRPHSPHHRLPALIPTWALLLSFLFPLSASSLSPLPTFNLQPSNLQPSFSPPPSLPLPHSALQLSNLQLSFLPYELVTSVSWSPTGETLAVAAGNFVRLFTAEDLQPLAEFDLRAFTHSLAFNPTGDLLAAGSRDGIVRVWEVGGSDISLRLELDAHKKGVNCVLFSPDGSLLASGGNDAVARLWDPATGDLQQEIIGGTFAVPNLAFNPAGDSLAMVNGGTLRLREVASGRITGTFQIDGPLYTVAYHPQGNQLAVGGMDNLVRLWDPADAYTTSNQQFVEPLVLTAHSGSPETFRALVWSVAYSPDGARLASAGGDGAIHLWDVTQAAPALIASFTDHTAAVTSLAFSPDGRRLLSGSLDATLRIWNLSP